MIGAAWTRLRFASPVVACPLSSGLCRPASETGGGPARCGAGPPSHISRPVSRVLYGGGRSPTRDGHSSGTPVARRFEQPTRTAGSGHRSWSTAAACAVQAPRRPYSVLLPVGFAVPIALPQSRCALTAPFHPYRGPLFTPGGARAGLCGGLFSVALSLGSPPPDVIRHRMSVEPGLSSPVPPPYPPIGSR